MATTCISYMNEVPLNIIISEESLIFLGTGEDYYGFRKPRNTILLQTSAAAYKSTESTTSSPQKQSLSSLATSIVNGLCTHLTHSDWSKW